MKTSVTNLIFNIHCIIITSYSKYFFQETSTVYYNSVCLLFTVKICLQLIPLLKGNLFLMIGTLEVPHEIIHLS